MYNPEKFLKEEEIIISDETNELIKKADLIYKENFDGKVWYGRCIFMNWYCSIATCTFCYRSTPNHQAKHAEASCRSMGSILSEAILCKAFNWRIEFLTGGYGLDFGKIMEVVKAVNAVYGKLWLNIGVLSEDKIDEILPYIEGVCGSMESLHPEIHETVCPDKPILPYSKMFNRLHKQLKRSIAVIVGLGDSYNDMEHLYSFIEEHDISRVTLYALKPIKGGAFDEGPTTDVFAGWISRLRIRFPKMEIIAGTNLRRCEETELIIKAGANAITKFPATKEFGSDYAIKMTDMINKDRKFISNIIDSNVNWDDFIKLVPEKYQEEVKKTLPLYIKSLSKSSSKSMN